MTDRYCGFIVTLDRETRKDDADATIKAIGQIKGVISVKPVESRIEIHIAREQVKRELCDRMLEILK